MNRKIWKYNVSTVDRQDISMPQGANFLCVKVQRGKPRLWALIDELKKPIRYRIYTFGTGNPLPVHIMGLEYIDTYFTNDEELVWHVFGEEV